MNFWFAVFAVLAIVGAGGMIIFKSPVYSAMGLLLSLFAMAGIYVLLEAPVIAVFQIAVYVGAIMVLFIFVVMFLNLENEKGHHPFELRQIAIVVFCLGLAMGLGMLGFASETFGEGGLMPLDQSKLLAESLLGKYVVPFELISLFLVGAAIGAVALNRRKA